ncbi:MAG: hypothetical protein WCR01_11325 [Bacteroidota bacterium]
MEKEIELKFIETTLQQYGARLQSALVKAISDKGLVSKEGTNHLKDSISYDVKRTGPFGYQLQLYFPDYGRFIEIRYHVGPPKTSDAIFNGSKSGMSKTRWSTSDKKRPFGRKSYKDARWYSKTAYGSLNSLIGQLMYGLTDAVQETLKEQLNQPI